MSLLVLEGLDGSGKNTQATLLFEALRKETDRVRKITFPNYASPSSSLVKMYLAGDFGSDAEGINAYAAGSFYAVDRFASYQQDWKGDFLADVPILADRYTTSNLVYQLSKLPRQEWERYMVWLEDFEYEKLGIPRPACVIYLDMPVEISQVLLSGRYGGDEGKKDIHEKDLEFLKKCRESAEFAAERLGWKVVSCGENNVPRPVEAIHREVLALAKAALL